MNSGSDTFYPARSFIRFQAKLQIIADLSGEQVTSFIQRPGVYIDRPVFHYDDELSDQATSTDDPSLNLAAQAKPRPDRFKAAAQAIADRAKAAGDAAVETDGEEEFLNVDEELLNEIAETTFHPDRHPELYQPCSTAEAAAVIEQQIAAELIATYEHIIVNQADDQIQQLNSLL